MGWLSVSENYEQYRLRAHFGFSYETGRVFRELGLSFISGATEFLFRVQSRD